MENDTDISELDNLLDDWHNDPTFDSNICFWHKVDRKIADFLEFPADLSIPLRDALINIGISKLYSHQLESYLLVNEGINIAVTTGTASGKSMCYNLPVINHLYKNFSSSALYLFPTKALAQDQLAWIENLLADLNKSNSKELSSPISAAIYDGDTPLNHRQMIKETARILFSNPDMLHISILPHHTLWKKFLENIKFIIIDEMHIYRGVFGSHVANVLRRLKRIIKFYGASPQFILTSATIANPIQLAEQLTETTIRLVESDGAPMGTRQLIFYNPPIIDPQLGIRKSVTSECLHLGRDLAKSNIQTLIFAKSRRNVEQLVINFRKILPNKKNIIRGYRSGYLPKERRDIELSLRKGYTRLIVATNALELGINIGSMDATILAGYPGTIAASRQQCGRSGRFGKLSVSIFIASQSPLDQFVINHPDYFMGSNPEKALIDPDNLLILLAHIRCAIFELPFSSADPYGNVAEDIVSQLLSYLVNSGIVHKTNERYFWMSDQYPAGQISLRNIAGNTLLLQINDYGKTRTIGEIDQSSSYWMTHPQAIYIHDGQTYQVSDLDFINNIVRLINVDTDYYTEPLTDVKLELIEIKQSVISGGLQKYFGDIQVTSKVTGYRKIDWISQDTLSESTIEMPESQKRTMAYWFIISDAIVEKLRDENMWNNDQNIYGTSWKVIQNQVRQRDHYLCRICGKREQKTNHHIHHITPFRQFASSEQANQLDNLITLCPSCHLKAESVIRLRSGLSGLAYILHHLAPLFIMCDIADLGVYYEAESTLSQGHPIIALYDNVNGGIGLSAAVFDIHEQIIKSAYELISKCPCINGCPSCVGPCGERGIGSKAETLSLIIAIDKVKDG